MASSSQAGERGSIAFVSYARADAEFALRLARDLKSAGASVWLDQLDIIPGQRWDVAVQAALARCDPMLVILSPATADSNNVMDEVSYALEERKTIVPILHIQCAVPFRLRRLQYADFRQEYQHGLTTLLKTLEVDRTAHEAETPKAGDVKTNPDDGQPYVWIPPGEFQMGCSPGDNECAEDEKPAHTVRISRGFWLGQTPVTVGAYKRFAERTGVPMPGEPLLGKVKLNAQWSDLEQPMVGVTWEEARSYCESWANGRLPTEAEWEWAARAGSTAARYAELDVIAWYADNSGNQPLDSTRAWEVNAAGEREKYLRILEKNGNRIHRVKQKQPNSWGLYDMLGNMFEWVSDWCQEDYYRKLPSSATDPKGPPSGTMRVLRGGSWLNFPRTVRASFRSRNVPENRLNYSLSAFGAPGNLFLDSFSLFLFWGLGRSPR